jgi:uncharacterized protein (TIGR03000 family)
MAPGSFRDGAAGVARQDFNSFRGRDFDGFRGRDFDRFRSWDFDDRGRFWAGFGVGLGLGAAWSYPWFGFGWGGYGGWGYGGGWGGSGYGGYGTGSNGTDVAAAASYSPLADNTPADQGASEVASRQDQQAIARYANAVMIRIVVPSSDAQIVFNDEPTTQTGKIRVFASPPLDPAQEYTYTIQAQWTANGQAVKQTKQVTVHAGDRVTVEFREPGAKSGAGGPEAIRPGTTGKPVPAPPGKTPPPGSPPEAELPSKAPAP